ncbi:hypothetical protein AB0M11_31470 [Streptomyces sp. NPDC051987]|uniref:hypothetical protein n=1 Tax=Streptomyces sp. NPDC051987 TaxID=3155808 RepID=UPI003434FB3A
MSSTTARNRATLAVAALLMGAGLAAGATPADAQPARPAAHAAAATVSSASPATPQRAGWHLIWGPKTHSATHYWPTSDFIPDRRHLAVNFGCWGHDGAKLRAAIVRTKDKKVMATSGWDYCHDAAQRRLDLYNAAPGNAYYMRLQLSGPKHSIWAKAYDYHE